MPAEAGTYSSLSNSLPPQSVCVQQQQPHHSLTLPVTVPSSCKGSTGEWLHCSAGRRAASLLTEQQTLQRMCQVLEQSAAQQHPSFPPRISPLTEQREEGRDLGGEQEAEMKGSVCSSHSSSSKVNPGWQLLPAQASPGLKSSLRVPGDSQSQPYLHRALHFPCCCFPKAQTIPCWRPGGVTLVPAHSIDV